MARCIQPSAAASEDPPAAPLTEEQITREGPVFPIGAFNENDACYFSGGGYL
ncbi:MAG: hypothetical protein SOV63_10280 [Pyramidobacter porci]|nr:hypothetical protein [Pyramidobacter porci]